MHFALGTAVVQAFCFSGQGGEIRRRGAATVANSTQKRWIPANLRVFPRISRILTCYLAPNIPNLYSGRVCVTSQTSEGQNTSASLTRPRLNLRRQRCQRASKHSLYLESQHSSQLVAPRIPSRLQSRSPWLWKNPTWTKCKSCIGLTEPVSPTNDLTRPGAHLSCPGKTNQIHWSVTCRIALKLSSLSVSQPSSPLVAQPRKKKSWSMSPWLWKNPTWTRCKSCFGSAYWADPTPSAQGRRRASAPDFMTSLFRPDRALRATHSVGGCPC